MEYLKSRAWWINKCPLKLYLIDGGPNPECRSAFWQPDATRSSPCTKVTGNLKTPLSSMEFELITQSWRRIRGTVEVRFLIQKTFAMSITTS